MFARKISITGIMMIWVGLLGTASAQSLTARSSTLRYDYVYGAGADTHVGNGDIVDVELLADDSDVTGFSGETSGVLPNGFSYGAGVSVDIDYSYGITGPLSGFQSITASAHSEVSAASSGAGLAVMHSVNPGNETILTFHVDSPARYRLVGNITVPVPSFWSAVVLERFNGFNWGIVFHSYFTPTGYGDFDLSGALEPGDYRITSNVSLVASGNESWTGSYQYAFSVERPGDMNCDGLVNGEDVQAFATAVLDAAEFESTYQGCPILNGDFDGNQAVSVEDAEGFVDCVLSGSCL